MKLSTSQRRASPPAKPRARAFPFWTILISCWSRSDYAESSPTHGALAMSHHGVLNLNKPTDWTSRRAVDVVQRLARPGKVGHAGTLDPLAGGVLVVCVEVATRLIEYVQRMPKSYTGTFLLGRQSPTEDVDGEVTELDNPPVPSREQVTAAATAIFSSTR